MPFNVKINSTIECYLSSEKESKITEDNEDDEYPTITFTTNYIKLHDEGGYHPPKFLILDGDIHCLVKEELYSMGKLDKYKPYYDADHFDITMDTIYVMKNKVDEISKDDLKEYKRTEFTLPIRRRRRINKKLKSSKIEREESEELEIEEDCSDTSSDTENSNNRDSNNRKRKIQKINESQTISD